ncbi:MAG: hypothetical protein LC808_38325, partial [Actinobacteria bacterium]|nr:hypothetical protein [Actinomycetota bacterium]
VGLGEAQVTLPRAVDTQLACRVPVGAADCLGVTSSDLPAQVDKRDLGADGPGGGTLILDVRSGVGYVHVMRAR